MFGLNEEQTFLGFFVLASAYLFGFTGAAIFVFAYTFGKHFGTYWAFAKEVGFKASDDAWAKADLMLKRKQDGNNGNSGSGGLSGTAA